MAVPVNAPSQKSKKEHRERVRDSNNHNTNNNKTSGSSNHDNFTWRGSKRMAFSWNARVPCAWIIDLDAGLVQASDAEEDCYDLPHFKQLLPCKAC